MLSDHAINVAASIGVAFTVLALGVTLFWLTGGFKWLARGR